eukprot:gene12358-14498_t
MWPSTSSKRSLDEDDTREDTSLNTPPNTQEDQETQKQQEDDEIITIPTKFKKDSSFDTNAKKETKTPKANYRTFKTLEEFGYRYNEEGKLRSVNDPEGRFVFETQDHYERLGDVIADEIYKMMEAAPFGFTRHSLPLREHEEPEPSPHSCIFTSPDFETNTERLMVLICGSGEVKAGQWARSLCINDGLQTGSMLSYIQQAIDNKFSIIVLNPNLNYVNGRSVTGSETPPKHVIYSYDNFISKSPAKDVVVVAHSYGGQLSVELLCKRTAILDKLRVMGFTDSVHSGSGISTKKVKTFLENNCRNWVSSSKPLDTDFGENRGCSVVSAGINIHANTSASCQQSLFKYVLSKLEDKQE